jgi:hypothetical protein
MTRRMTATLVAAGALAAFFLVVAVAAANHVFPSLTNTGSTAATSFRVPMVPAYKPCQATSQGGTPTGTHSGVPGDSCIMSANTLAAGKAQLVSAVAYMGPTSIGWTQLSVVNGNTASVDIKLAGNMTDVRCKTAGTGGCATGQIDYNPNTTAGPYTTTGSGTGTPPSPPCTTLASCFSGRDMTATAEIPIEQYTGANAGMPAPQGAVTEHRAVADRAFHSTDHYNAKTTSSSCNTTKPSGYPAGDTTAPFCQGTTQDSAFPVPIVCTPNGSTTTAPGSSCGFNTTVNALVPGGVVNGKRSDIEVGQIEYYDAGANATAEFPAGDDKIIARQGLTVP